MSFRYKVYIAPLAADKESFDSYIDVSESVFDGEVSRIKRSVDSSDYGFGVFTLDDAEIKLDNNLGLFGEYDSLGIFSYGRDKSRVKINYVEFTDQGETEYTRFIGLINEEATRIDLSNQTIRLKVLSNASILRKEKIAGGVISNGQLASASILALLNSPPINTLLDIDVLNINVDTDIAIDNAESFNNKTVFKVLSELLLITNSVLTIEGTNTVVISSRDPLNVTNPLRLFGGGEIHKRENILSIKAYNSGMHRTFNSIKIGDTVGEETGHIQTYGFSQKTISINAIENTNSLLTIASRLAREFKFPKIELEVEVATSTVKDSKLLDPVSVSFEKRLVPTSQFLPIVGQTMIDSASETLPREFGGISIKKDIAFKIMEIKDDPKSFLSVVKLRQIGVSSGDGVFLLADLDALVGEAIIGESKVTGEGNSESLWNPAIVGANIINGIGKV